MGPYGGSPYQY